jgi:peptidyl-tRNA hydrolase, PTH1 family
MDTWLVVGLGNPGPSYAKNRHNVGAMVLAELAARTGSTLKRHKSRALVAQARLNAGGAGASSIPLVLAQPQTFMNESGGPVSGLLGFFGLGPDRLVVLHDEIDIPFGEVRLKLGGGEGGHNGLRSISTSLKSKDYNRVRIGVGRPPGRMDAADFVLRDFSPSERRDLEILIADGADAVEELLQMGLIAAQQRFHAPR